MLVVDGNLWMSLPGYHGYHGYHGGRVGDGEELGLKDTMAEVQ